MKGHEPAMKMSNATMELADPSMGATRSELSSSEVARKRGERYDVVVLVVPQLLAIHYGTNKVVGLGGSDGG
jgi:hypothetical protein